MPFLSQEPHSKDDGDPSPCSICGDPIGLPGDNGVVEKTYKLPCGHTFGSKCIIRWLQDSPKQNCPICRRRMVHSRCGHLIMPHAATSAPPKVREEDMPEQCVRCRGEGIVGQVLQQEAKRLEAAESALRALETLPKIYRSINTQPKSDLEGRIRDLRANYAAFHERVWREFEEKERRVRW